MIEGIYKDVADMIYERGAFKFGAFKLKLHEKNKNAPLSPFYVNLRTESNPNNPGPLTVEDCDLIARAIWKTVFYNCFGFSAIAGLPYAFDPIIAAIDRMVVSPRNFRIIKLSKEVEGENRRIVPLPGFNYCQGEVVLVLDDLITKADSKIEAINAIESEGSVVNDLVVLIDRQQGGREKLKKAGYNLISCFTIGELLDYYRMIGKIDEQKYLECISYISNN